MWDHARIRLHQGKTQLWNRGGVAPEGWDRLTASDPSAVVWKGDPSLPASGSWEHLWAIQNMCTTNCVGPVWTTDCCWNAFQQCRSSISMVVALILRRHARQLPPESHPTSVGIGVRGESHRVSANLFATNPGCRDSCRVVGSRCPPVAIRWIGPPEWTKGEPSGVLVQLGRFLVTTAKRQPAVAEQLVAALTNGEPGSYLDAAADACRVLLEADFRAPGWRDFVSDHPPRPGHNNMDDGEPGSRQGWQVVSSMSFGGTVCELEFVAAPHAPVLCFVPVPGRPIGEFAFHQLPCRPSPVRFSAVPFASSAPPLAPSSLHCAYLPVWPATRLSWPPPHSVLYGGGSGT